MDRAAGILLSVTSLPSRYGIGCFDRSACEFVDFLAETGQTYWQILPLGPTSCGASGDSPYQAYSAFAGNPYFISLDALVEEGALRREECDSADFGAQAGRVDYEKLHAARYPLLRRAYERSGIGRDPAFRQFVEENRWWLDDYALFMAVKGALGDAPWSQWPEDIRLRREPALERCRRELRGGVEFQQYLQYQFFRQWEVLKEYANRRHIQIIGDIPIYVSPDSADVWAHPELFQLDGDRVPTAVAGCPPDGFSADGQLWGNPLYRWDYHRDTGYDWWIARLRHSFQLYDVVRIDHFRGFDEYYSIPYGSETAANGRWEKGPGIGLFRRAEQCLGRRPVIAEDLGFMTDSVRQLVRESGFPNMKVLEFAFDARDTGSANDYLPHNYGENCVVYTGTHDNETIAGWLGSIRPEELAMARDYLCDHFTPMDRLYRCFVCLAMRSRARTCIIPMQDHLGLGNECRMNRPSTVGENWRWRLEGRELTPALREDLLRMTRLYGRMNRQNDT